jgi:hypothetical protein
MAFFGQDPVLCKLTADNKCLQQVRNFKYFGREISFENEKIIQKTSKFFENTGNSKQQF